MNFLAPAAFAFAAAIPVVIVFYLLKRKRVVRFVSSTLLWQKFLSGDPGERALSAIAEKLAADITDHFADSGGAGAVAAIFCGESQTGSVAGGGSGCVGIDAVDR